MTGFYICCGILALGALAFWHSMKLWSVTVIAFNLMFSTLLSMGLFRMVANILDGAVGVMSYYNDMLAFMLIFLIVLAILMFLTKKISKVDVNFSDKTDKIAKWITCIVMILGFSGTAVFVFYETMPEKPSDATNLPTMQMVDFMSKGSLKPLIGSSEWNTKEFCQGQYKRNAGVYEQTVENGAEGWKFDGDSPNAE